MYKMYSTQKKNWRAAYHGGWSGQSIDFAVFLRYGNGLHMKPQILSRNDAANATYVLTAATF